MKRLLVALVACLLGFGWVLTSATFPPAPVPGPSRSALPSTLRVVAPIGAVTIPGGFRSVAPSRLLDTRSGIGATTVAVAAGATLPLQVGGRGGVPASGASAVVLNVTLSSPTTLGFVTVYRHGTTLPFASNLNFVAGQTVRNVVFVPVGANGQVDFHNGSQGTVQLRADVSGYYLAGVPTAAGAFGSLPPTRLLDTRIGVGAARVAVAARAAVHLQVSGKGGVPASGVSAVVLNVAATEPTKAGSITVYRAGSAMPPTPNLSFMAAQSVPNLVLAPVGANGQVDLYNGSDGTVQLVADVSGYYLAGAPTVAGAFGPLAPSRVLDTGFGLGPAGAAIASEGTVRLQVTGRAGVPTSGVSAVMLNVTVNESKGAGSVSVSGQGTSFPHEPNVGFVGAAGVPSLVQVPVGANGKIVFHNDSAGRIRLIADIVGYYNSRDKIAAVSTGTSHSCAVTTGGGVKCWGFNADGELGDGTTVSSAVPVDVVGLDSGASAASAGLGHTCAVTSTGVKCWGLNTDGELGDGTTVSSAVPVDVVGLGPGVVAVSAGWSHTCAVTSAGAVKCWGRNPFGELGDGTTTSSTVPVDVVGLGGKAVAVEVGAFHSCVRTSAGGVRCWGYNAEGELGDGTTTRSAVPVDVVGLGSGVVAVSAGGYHSCAVTSVGALRCWGHDPNGELGDGTTADSAVPVDVLGLGGRVVAVSAGWSHTCAVISVGGVKCWGGSTGDELGTGTTAQSADPVGVLGLGSGSAGVSAGGRYSCARSSVGAVSCWGHNANGELGAGTNTNSAVPVSVLGLG